MNLSFAGMLLLLHFGGAARKHVVGHMGLFSVKAVSLCSTELDDYFNDRFGNCRIG